MLEALLYIMIGKLLAFFGVKYLGAARFGRIIEAAKKILGDPKNPITDVSKAAEQAVIADRFNEMDQVFAELERQKRAGELEIRAAEARAREVAPLPENVTRLPVDP